MFGWCSGAAHDASDSTELAAGRDHSLAIADPGTLWAWGTNHRGQLGDGTTTPRAEPVQVGTDNDWSTVSAGVTHTLAIEQDGSLWGFGGRHGFTPVRIGDGHDWHSVAAGDSGSFGIPGAGTLWKWGTSEGVAASRSEGLLTSRGWKTGHRASARRTIGRSPSARRPHRTRRSSSPSIARWRSMGGGW